MKSELTTTMRPYELRDIPELLRLAKEHIPQLPNYKDIKVDTERLAYLLRHNHGNASYFQAWVLVNEKEEIVGTMSGYCTQGMFTWDFIATDVFLFVLEEYRTLKRATQLVEAYKSWAIARGAVLVKASVSGGQEPEAFDLFMKRLGFEDVGKVYHLRNDGPYLTKQLNALKS